MSTPTDMAAESIDLVSPSPFISSAKIGAVAGAGGLIFGGVKGILTSHPNPRIHSLAHGIYWSSIAIPFWFARSNLLHIHYSDQASPSQRVYASALAGALSGGTASALVGAKRRFVLGAVVVASLASVGQITFNLLDASQARNADAPKIPFLQRLANSKWIPLRTLPDEEYAGMLREQLLGVETQIALIDDQIEELKKQRAEMGKDDVPK